MIQFITTWTAVVLETAGQHWEYEDGCAIRSTYSEVVILIGWFVRQGKEASIAAMGGQFSVVVDREHVTYSATVLKADVPKAMEILATAAKVGSASQLAS